MKKMEWYFNKRQKAWENRIAPRYFTILVGILFLINSLDLLINNKSASLYTIGRTSRIHAYFPDPLILGIILLILACIVLFIGLFPTNHESELREKVASRTEHSIAYRVASIVLIAMIIITILSIFIF
jgi:hypothetical protein